MTISRQLVTSFGQHRFAILFYSLLLTLLLDPLLQAFGYTLNLLQVLLALNLLAATLGHASDTGIRWLPAASGLAVVLLLAAAGFDSASLTTPSLALWSVLCLAAALRTLRYALRRGPVDAERVYAALSVYLLAGLVFGVAYWMIAQRWPGSFAVPGGEALSVGRAIYFSFVTLATLGYGDVVPLLEPGRSFAIIEAMGGQMYLTVLVARLVSLYAAETRERHASRDRDAKG